MRGRVRLAAISLAAYGIFITTVIAMPFLKDAYSPVGQTISEGAIGDFAWVQTAGFFALAAASLGVSWLLYGERESRPPIALTAGILAFSTVFTIALAVVPTDAPDEDTAGGAVHVGAAALAFLVAIAGILSASVTFRGHELLGRLAPWSLAAGLLAFALLTVTGLGVEPSGVWQRATVAVEVLWFVAVGVTFLVAGTQVHRSAARHAAAASATTEPG